MANFAPLFQITDTSRDQLLKYLACKMYAGGGGQSVYG